MDNTTYWNIEDDDKIICPYCGEVYEPSYEDTYIGDKCVNCYTDDTGIYTCDECGKKFKMYGYQSGWNYHTETIEGQMTEEEWEKNYGYKICNRVYPRGMRVLSGI